MDMGQEKYGPKRSTLALLFCCARSNSTSPPPSHPTRQPPRPEPSFPQRQSPVLLPPNTTRLCDASGPQRDGFTAALPSRPTPTACLRSGPQIGRVKVQYPRMHHPAVLTPGIKQASSARVERLYSDASSYNRVYDSGVTPWRSLSRPVDLHRGLQTVHHGRNLVDSSDNSLGGTRARTISLNTGDVSPLLDDGDDDDIPRVPVSPLTPSRFSHGMC